MATKPGYQYCLILCSCGQAVKENWMVRHVKSGHLVPKPSNNKGAK